MIWLFWFCRHKDNWTWSSRLWFWAAHFPDASSKTSTFVASDMAGNRLGVLFKNSQWFHALKCWNPVLNSGHWLGCLLTVTPSPSPPPPDMNAGSVTCSRIHPLVSCWYMLQKNQICQNGSANRSTKIVRIHPLGFLNILNFTPVHPGEWLRAASEAKITLIQVI